MIKKIIYRALCNRIVGSVLSLVFSNTIPSLRWPGYRFNLSKENTTKTIVASVFWGFYESAEVRLVRKYFKGDVDSIELGASSGIVSSHICSKYSDSSRRYIGVEANSTLSKTWHINVNRHLRAPVNVTLVHAAIYYEAETVSFNVCSNPTESSVGSSASNTSVETIKTVGLSGLVQLHSVSDYALFCDIEGAEAAVIMNEDQIFKSCKYIFIELHDTFYKERAYSVDELKSMIVAKGFELVDRLGPVCYFCNKGLRKENHEILEK